MMYCGIDVGRTSIKLACQDSRQQQRRVTLPAPPQEIPWHDAVGVTRRISQWLETGGMHPEKETVVVIGAAGAAEYERTWSRDHWHITLVGDITLAAISCGVEQSGLLTICGTGGVLVVFRDASRQILESFGPVIGDRWGGVALGRKALRFVVNTLSFQNELTDYAQALADELGVRSRKEYLDWLRRTPNPYPSLAGLGQQTVAFAEEGDEVAGSFCRETVVELARSVREAGIVYALTPPVPLGIQGSILEKSEWMRRELEQALMKAGVAYTLRLPEKPLEDYALEMSLRTEE